MKVLNIQEISQVNGAAIRPSEWTWSAAYGMTLGVVCSLVSGFSKNPISMTKALALGAGVATGVHITHDILREAERNYF